MPTLNVQNRTLFHGDNLPFLRGINSKAIHVQLHHNTPSSDGGLNHISNRLLLCGPCNRIKSNRLTLSGLRAENQKRDQMAK